MSERLELPDQSFRPAIKTIEQVRERFILELRPLPQACNDCALLVRVGLQMSGEFEVRDGHSETLLRRSLSRG